MHSPSFSSPLDGVTVFDLYNAFLSNHLFLRPVRKDKKNSFQRWQWWPRKKKIYLLHSIFEGTTLPPIYVYKDTRKLNWYIVDGQQRLSCLFEFLQNEIKLSQSGMMENSMETLAPELDGKSWEQLDEDTQNIIGSYELRVEEVRRPKGMDDDQFDKRVRDFFHRINVTSGGMSEQEINNNRHAGRLTDLLFDLQGAMGFAAPEAKSLSMSPDEAGADYFLFANKVCSRTDLLRMNDLELTLELIFAQEREMCAQKKAGLEEFYEEMEGMSSGDYSRIREEFLQGIDTLQELMNTGEFSLRDTRFRKKNDFYTLFFATTKVAIQSYGGAARSLTQFDNLLDAVEKDNKPAIRKYPAKWVALAMRYLESLHKDWSFKMNREVRVAIFSELLARERGLLA